MSFILYVVLILVAPREHMTYQRQVVWTSSLQSTGRRRWTRRPC